MQSLPVVEDLDVLERRGLHAEPRFKAFTKQPLVLEAVEPTLRRIVS